MSRLSPPYRADHVGSLLRPQKLLEARGRFQEEISAAELRAAEDEAIAEAIKKEEGVGLHSITDGEFRRTFFHLDFLEQVGGAAVSAPLPPTRTPTCQRRLHPTPAGCDRQLHHKEHSSR